MDLTASERLTDLEDKMVKALEREWERWNESTGPLPSALVMLMDKAHRAIFSRVGKSAGMDLNEMMRNPEAALVEIDKRKALLLKLLEQKNTQRATGTNGAVVFPFPVAAPTKPKE